MDDAASTPTPEDPSRRGAQCTAAGRDKEAAEHCCRELALREQRPAADPRVLLDCRLKAATACARAADWPRVLDLLAGQVEAFQECFGTKAPPIQHVFHLLGTAAWRADEGAVEQAIEYLTAAAQLPAGPGDAGRILVSEIYVELGLTNAARQDHAAAVKWFGQAIAARKRLAHLLDLLQDRRLAQCHLGLGLIHLLQAHHAQAEIALRAHLAIANRCADTPADHEQVTECVAGLADCLHERGRADEAMAMVNKYIMAKIDQLGFDHQATVILRKYVTDRLESILEHLPVAQPAQREFYLRHLEAWAEVYPGDEAVKKVRLDRFMKRSTPAGRGWFENLRARMWG